MRQVAAALGVSKCTVSGIAMYGKRSRHPVLESEAVLSLPSGRLESFDKTGSSSGSSSRILSSSSPLALPAGQAAASRNADGERRVVCTGWACWSQISHQH